MNVHYPLILDGATGTELAKAGLTADNVSELWMLDHEEEVLRLQEGYVRAGAEVIYTPTFSASPVSLEKHGLADRTRELNLRLAGISKKAAAGKALVAGDIGPGGLMPRPFGHLSFEQMVDAFACQAEALEEAGVDLFVVETQMSIAEARAAFLGVRKVSAKPVFVSFTCNQEGKTLDGCDMASALVIMQAMGAAAVGLNCSWGPEQMLPVLKRLAPYAKVPLIAKPNAGMPEFVDGKAVYRCTPEEFTSVTAEMIKAGALILGGCCGTTAEHIRACAEKVKAFAGPLPEISAGGREYCAGQRVLLPADEALPFGERIACGSDFEEKAEEFDGEEIPVLVLDGHTDFEAFENAQYMIDGPVCFEAEDEKLLERALRLYRGRALYRGSLSDDAAAAFSAAYGLIVL